MPCTPLPDIVNGYRVMPYIFHFATHQNTCFCEKTHAKDELMQFTILSFTCKIVNIFSRNLLKKCNIFSAGRFSASNPPKNKFFSQKRECARTHSLPYIISRILCNWLRSPDTPADLRRCRSALRPDPDICRSRRYWQRAALP